MKKIHENDLSDEDRANFSLPAAVFVTLAALLLAFWGYPKDGCLKFSQEWRITQNIEVPNLILHVNQHQFIASVESQVLLISRKLNSFSTSKSGNGNDEILSRSSLLGKTRVSRGRNSKFGCVSKQQAAIGTEAGVLVGFSIDHTQIRSLWETSFDTEILEACAFITKSNFTSVVIVGKSANPKPSHRFITSLDSKTGSVIWKSSITDNLTKNPWPGPNSSHILRYNPEFLISPALDPFPDETESVGFYKLKGKPENTMIVTWEWGAALFDIHNGIIQSVQPFAKRVEDEFFRVDIDGDGNYEFIDINHGKDSCMDVTAYSQGTRKIKMKYDECNGLAFKKRSAFIVALKRQKSRPGASALLGNLTLNRFEARGYDLVVYNHETGNVICITPDGKLKWASSQKLLPPTSISSYHLKKRLQIIPGFSKNSYTQTPLVGTTTSYLLAVGNDQAVILRGSDGFVCHHINLNAYVKYDAVIEDNQIGFVLDTGDIVKIIVERTRDVAPSLMLIPVAIISCSMWACYAWARFDE